MVTLYHNPRCSKSRQALALLQERGIEPDIVLYLNNPPSANTLRQILSKLGIPARDLLRTGETIYKDLGLDDSQLNEHQLIEAMVKHPKLIERPIALNEERAVIGRPPENVLSIL